MNETEQYVFEAIQKWVWSGFYAIEEMDQMIDDILEEDCDEKMLRSMIRPELEKKLEQEKSWPATTDYDTLHRVFYDLHDEGICALHNAGYTMSDGFSDVSDAIHDAPADHYRGFCFYHGQDVEGAIAGRGLMIAYGDINNDEASTAEIGLFVKNRLVEAGFEVQWDGSTNTRIFLPAIKWQKRSTS